MKKVTKKSSQFANLNLFLARKACRIAAEKIAVRTELASQPHYYQRMQ